MGMSGMQRLTVILLLMLDAVTSLRGVRPMAVLRMPPCASSPLSIAAASHGHFAQYPLSGPWNLDQSVLPPETHTLKTLSLLAVVSMAILKALPTPVRRESTNLLTGLLNWQSGMLQRASASLTKLIAKESVGGGIIKFLFKASDRDEQLGKLKFVPGQKLVVGAVDDNGAFVKSSHFCRRCTDAPNMFEIYEASLSRRRVGSALLHIRPDQSPEATPTAAFRRGEQGLKYSGKDAIRNIQMVASGVGIVAALPVLNAIFADEDVEIDQCILLWINDHKDSFILDNEVSALEGRAGGKLEVLRIVQPDLNVLSSTIHPNIKQLIPGFSNGSAALIAGPTVVTDKLLAAFAIQHYPQDNIVVLAV